MDNKTFIKNCEDLIIEYYNNSLDETDHYKIKDKDIECVWYNTIKGYNKGVFTSNETITDEMYFEITYDCMEKIFYFNAYKKWLHQRVEI